MRLLEVTSQRNHDFVRGIDAWHRVSSKMALIVIRLKLLDRFLPAQTWCLVASKAAHLWLIMITNIIASYHVSRDILAG